MNLVQAEVLETALSILGASKTSSPCSLSAACSTIVVGTVQTDTDIGPLPLRAHVHNYVSVLL